MAAGRAVKSRFSFEPHHHHAEALSGRAEHGQHHILLQSSTFGDNGESLPGEGAPTCSLPLAAAKPCGGFGVIF